jgi:hypothetical protein
VHLAIRGGPGRIGDAIAPSSGGGRIFGQEVYPKVASTRPSQNSAQAVSFSRVKRHEESHQTWDEHALLGRVPADHAYADPRGGAERKP